MSTFKYDTAVVAFGTKQLSWTAGNIAGMLIGPTYAPSKAKDQFVSDIPSDAIIARSAHMTSPAIVGGVCRGLVPEFDAVASALPVSAFILYADTGDDTTSQLIYYSDEGNGFPFVAAGFNYFVTYDQANGGWFQL